MSPGRREATRTLVPWVAVLPPGVHVDLAGLTLSGLDHDRLRAEP